jgi:hypothetical protein
VSAGDRPPAATAVLCVAPAIAQAHTSGFSAGHSLTVVAALRSDEFSGHVESAQAACVPGGSITLCRAAGSGLTDLAAATATTDAQGLVAHAERHPNWLLLRRRRGEGDPIAGPQTHL